MTTQDIFPILGILGASGWWLVVSRPQLRLLGAPRAERAGLVLTIATIAVAILAVVLSASPGESVGWWLWAGIVVVWIVAFVLDAPSHSLLLRLTGVPESHGALRTVLWNLGFALSHIAQADNDPRWNRQAQNSVDWLAKLRSPDTNRIIDLWLAENDAVRRGGADPSASERHAAITAEAHRVWPVGDDWEMAALVE